MNRAVIAVVISLGVLPGLHCHAADILFMHGGGNPEYDDQLVGFIELLGHTVTRYDTIAVDFLEQLELAASHDLVYVTESLGSTTTHDGFETLIKEVPTPQIWAEAYDWDEAAMTADIIFEDYGNTQRADGAGPEGFDVGQDSIFIQNEGHPMAAGLTGSIQVYEELFSLSWGLVDTMGPDVDVIASVDEAGEYATLFSYEKGALLADGEPAAEKRIGIFLGQPGIGNISFDNIHGNGLGLLIAAINYGLGLTESIGDFNGDGVWDTMDIDLLGKEIIAGTNNSDFDITGDAAVNQDDLNQWLSDAATENGFGVPYLGGDANLDGTVDAQDLNSLALNWQQNVDPWSQGDFNTDGFVDASDLNALALNWQSSIPSAAAAVPEPNSLAILCLCVITIVLGRRRSDSG